MFATILLACLLGVTSSAPLEQFAPSEILQTRQYLLFSPHAQLQLQPAFKLQQPILQPLASLGKIDNGNEQTILLYPNLPLTQVPQVSVKQNQWIDQINTIIASWGFPTIDTPALPIQNPDDDNDDKKKILPKIEINRDAETIPEIAGQTPAGTVPLNPERRFYVISGRPQFFGNFDGIQNPLHPIFSLQPLQPIKARSVADSIAEVSENDKNLFESSVPASDLVPISLPLRSGAEEPVQLDEKQKIISEQVEQVAEDAFSSRFLDAPTVQARSVSNIPSEANQAEMDTKNVNIKEETGFPIIAPSGDIEIDRKEMADEKLKSE